MCVELNPFQAKYFAHELRRSYANDHVGKLAGLLFDAQVELKPHQQEDSQQKIYMIRETKSTQIDEKLRPTEVAKIKCGKKHFAAIGIDDYAKASPGDWRL